MKKGNYIPYSTEEQKEIFGFTGRITAFSFDETVMLAMSPGQA